MTTTSSPTSTTPTATPRAKLVTIGLLSGALSGLFGIGGGVLIVPALTAWCRRDQRQAVATSLMALGPLAVAGAITYGAHGEVDVLIAIPMAIGSLIGAWIGAKLLPKVPVRMLRWLFAVLVLGTAIRMLSDPGVSEGDVQHTWWKLLLVIPVGIAVGLIAGLTGIGGGTVMVPVMQLGGAGAALAKGTSLLVILPTSFLGGWRNLRHGNGSLRDALWIGGSGVLATVAASLLAVDMDSELSDVLFAGLLCVVVVRTLWGDVVGLLRRRSA